MRIELTKLISVGTITRITYGNADYLQYTSNDCRIYDFPVKFTLPFSLHILLYVYHTDPKYEDILYQRYITIESKLLSLDFGQVVGGPCTAASGCRNASVQIRWGRKLSIDSNTHENRLRKIDSLYRQQKTLPFHCTLYVSINSIHIAFAVLQSPYP